MFIISISFLKRKIEINKLKINDTQTERLACFGHIQRIDNNRVTKYILKWNPSSPSSLS